MQPSLLRLNKIYFRRIRLDAAEKPGIGKGELKLQVEVLRNKENAAQWRVELTVWLGGQDAPYTGEICAVGEYAVGSEQSEEAASNLVNVNGPSVLYSSIRELVLTLSGRGPYPSLLLPSITFIDRKQKTKEVRADGPAVKKVSEKLSDADEANDQPPK